MTEHSLSEHKAAFASVRKQLAAMGNQERLACLAYLEQRAKLTSDLAALRVLREVRESFSPTVGPVG